MDSELRFISALLSANQAEQQEYFLKQLPLSIFPLREKEMFWLMRFREKHGKFPTPETYEAKYRETLEPVNDPLSAVLSPLLVQTAYTQVKKVIDTTSGMFDDGKEAEEILNFFRSSSEKLTSFTTSYVDENLNESDLAWRRYKEQSRQRLSAPGSFVDTPWPRLNRLINFVRPGEVVVLAARLGMGKSWCVFHWANHLALKGISTYIMSKEMPGAQVADRLTALRFELDWEKYRALQFDIDDEVRWKIAKHRAKNEPYPLLVSGEETFEGTGIEQLHSKVLKMRPQVVVVDGAYLLSPMGVSKNASPTEIATANSRALKRLAKVTNTCVIAVVQMNRTAETKAGVAMGGVSTIYQSDAWAQDADCVIEIAGERGAPERVLSVHKSRETNIGDFFVNFKLSPRPDFSEKAVLSGASALSKRKFNPLK